MNEGSPVHSHEIIVPRTARYATLGADATAIEEVWLACHGYGQLASRFIRRFGPIDNGKRLIVAPEALSRFYVSGGTGPHSPESKVGASWMTREGKDAEIADQVTYLDRVLDRALEGVSRAQVRIVGFGFSQGAATICRWAARTASPPAHLVLWGSGVPAELLDGEGKGELTRARLTIVVGSRDPIAHGDRVEMHRKQLESAGVDYRFVAYDGGHDVDGVVLAEIAQGVGGEGDVRGTRIS